MTNDTQRCHFRKETQEKEGFLPLSSFWNSFFHPSVEFFLKRCLFERMKELKYFIILSFIVSFFIPASWAQQDKWPWTSEGGNFQITNDSSDDFSPAIASACKDNSCLYLVVWSRRTSSGFDIYGARIHPDGTVFEEDVGGIAICTAQNDQMFPSVASDGENFLVVWQDMQSGKRWEIYGARVTNDRQVSDPFPIATAKSTYDQVSPALAFDGEDYLVAWQGKRNQKLWNIYFTRVSRVSMGEETIGGTPGTSIAVAPSLKNQVSPSVAFNGENCFIVWQDFRNGRLWDIYGARVTQWGKRLDGNGIRMTYGDGTGLDSRNPILSWNGFYYLVVWMVSPEAENWFLYGKQINSQGKMSGVADLPIQRGSSNKVFPAILWDGSEYLMVWEEDPEENPKIFGAFIPIDNISFVDSKMEISGIQQANASLPALSKAADNILIVWQAKGEQSTWQIFGQRLKKAPLEQGDRIQGPGFE